MTHVYIYLSFFTINKLCLDIRTYIQSLPKQFNGQLIKHGSVVKNRSYSTSITDRDSLKPSFGQLDSLKQSKSEQYFHQDDYNAN